MKSSTTIRKAKLSDIPALSKHRRLMFEEMWRLDERPVVLEEMSGMETAYIDYLKINLKNGQLSAWVVECDGQVIASGALSVLIWPPLPGNSSGKKALLHSLFVDEKHRRAGIARQIMQSMIAYCRLNNLRSVSLNASRAGQALYEALGFEAHPTIMKLRI